MTGREKIAVSVLLEGSKKGERERKRARDRPWNFRRQKVRISA
jgi:hypothetical protein